MNVRWSIVISLAGICVSFCPAGESPAPARLKEPQLHVKRVLVPNFGDDEIVRLLGGLLGDADELVRERAAADLGDTHNPVAIAVLRRALADRSYIVRCAAVASAAEIGGSEGAGLVQEALERNDPPLLRAALQCAQRMKLTTAKDRIAALLERDEPDLRVEAMSVLTALKQPAPVAALGRMLKARNVQEPLHAAQNAVLLSTAPGLVAPLKGLTDEDRPPAVRAAAIEALGALDFEDSGPFIISAAQASDALVRRAVVRVFQRQGMSEAVLPMLDDPTALVRLAAVRAAGTLRIESAVKKLTEILLSAPDDLTHQAAHEALRRITGPAVESSVAAVLPSLTDELQRNQKAAGKIAGKVSALSKLSPNPEKLSPEKQKELDALNAQRDQLKKSVLLGERNLASCCRLLGLLKSHAGYRQLLEIPRRLQIDSPVLGEVALALGRIGDERAIAPLHAVLEKCRQQAGPYLAAMMSMSPPPPFSQEVTGKVIQALVMLNDQQSLDAMLSLATIQVGMVRLSEVAEYVVRYAPALAGDADKEKIEQLVLTILTDETFELTAQWYACKTAGTYKLSAALTALKDILNEQRPCLSSMVIAGWAIQEITGQTPPIPQPRLKQGDWILRKYVRREE